MMSSSQNNDDKRVQQQQQEEDSQQLEEAQEMQLPTATAELNNSDEDEAPQEERADDIGMSLTPSTVEGDGVFSSEIKDDNNGAGAGAGASTTTRPTVRQRRRLSQQELVDRRATTQGRKENGLDTYFPDPDIDSSTLIENLAWWAEFTSIHGVYYAFERGHFEKWKLRLWSILVLVCTASLIGTLSGMVKEYRQYKLNSATQVFIPPSLEFPQVTICNSNAFSLGLQEETGILEPTNEQELEAISQPLEDFIVYSSFNNAGMDVINSTASSNDMTWIPMITSRGRCFTYNNSDLSVVQPGPQAGLELWAWLDQDNYDSDTFDAGLYVFVEQSGTTMISDQTKQTLVPAGMSAFLSIHKKVQERTTQKPWSKCFSKAPQYTNAVCRAQCVHNATRSTCGCRRIGDPINTDDQGNVIPYCGSDGNYSFNPCSLILNDQILRDCDCTQPPCSEEEYTVSFSATGLGRPFLRKFRQDYEELWIQNSTVKPIENLVRVRVNFDSIRYERTIESPDKTFGQLISDMGGQMGFFMGISVISIIELFGELMALRLLPRLWGDYRLYGIGQRSNRQELGKVY